MGISSTQLTVGSFALGWGEFPAVAIGPGTGGGTITVSAGSATILYEPAGYAPGLSITDDSDVIFAPAPAGSGINSRALDSLAIGPGATARVSAASLSDRAVMVLGSLALSPTGKLDLTDNDLVVRAGNLSSITASLKSGFNSGGATWQGYGIISAAAAADPSQTAALGVLINNNGLGGPIYDSTTHYGAFDGLALSNSDVLVKYTTFGDADLSGRVDGADYSEIDNGFDLRLAGWVNGDFNYDGSINGADYALIDNAFNQQQPVSNAVPSALSSLAGLVRPFALQAHPLSQLSDSASKLVTPKDPIGEQSLTGSREFGSLSNASAQLFVDLPPVELLTDLFSQIGADQQLGGRINSLRRLLAHGGVAGRFSRGDAWLRDQRLQVRRHKDHDIPAILIG
jgi:hypothetical protein